MHQNVQVVTVEKYKDAKWILYVTKFDMTLYIQRKLHSSKKVGEWSVKKFLVEKKNNSNCKKEERHYLNFYSGQGFHITIKTGRKKVELASKLAINKKSTIFAQFSWNFVKMTITSVRQIAKVSGCLDKNWGIFANSPFLS